MGGETVFSEVHPDIIKSHVLSRLDGPSLGAAACCSTTIRRLSSDDSLWSDICHSTWPSTSTSASRLTHLIHTFGPRSFFSEAYPIPLSKSSDISSEQPAPAELISGVDIHYKDNLIFSKTQETETLSGWFRCSPFRIDLLDPKDVVPTPIKGHDHICTDIINNMTLSWILIDVIGRRVVNLSSHKPVAVQRHWLTGEVQARYASIHGHVQCQIVVTCGGGGGEEDQMLHVKEVCLQMEDMDGMHLNGKDSLVFLQRAFHAKKGSGKNRVQQGQLRYKEYVEMKKQRREKKLRTEEALDTFCLAFGAMDEQLMSIQAKLKLIIKDYRHYRLIEWIYKSTSQSFPSTKTFKTMFSIITQQTITIHDSILNKPLVTPKKGNFFKKRKIRIAKQIIAES